MHNMHITIDYVTLVLGDGDELVSSRSDDL